MLKQFPQAGEPDYPAFGLPGGFDYFTDPSVILSFDDIYQAGLSLVSGCTKQAWGHHGRAGWRPVGT